MKPLPVLLELLSCFIILSRRGSLTLNADRRRAAAFDVLGDNQIDHIIVSSQRALAIIQYIAFESKLLNS